jgi:hypothetical protein
MGRVDGFVSSLLIEEASDNVCLTSLTLWGWPSLSWARIISDDLVCQGLLGCYLEDVSAKDSWDR